MSAQDNEALVRRFFEEVWAKANVAAVDEFMAADYYVEHTEHAVPPGARPGRDSVKQRIALYYEAFPDWKVTCCLNCRRRCCRLWWLRCPLGCQSFLCYAAAEVS